MSAAEGCDDHAVMPWDESHFPRSMVNLSPAVRSKAIEIANALLAEGYDEERAIRISIWQAKRWGAVIPATARRHG
jgi:uncharacterized protein YdaT